MCKIAGGIFNSTETRQADIIVSYGSNLLVCAEGVNTHATGVAIVNPTGIHVYKNNKPATDFVTDKAWTNFVYKHADTDTIAFIGHCRFATQGSNMDNTNNHPIIDRPIYGVHNGVISNDAEIAKEYGRCADVDSAVMFSMLKKLSGKNALRASDFVKGMNKLNGSATIVAVDERDPTKIFFGLKNNPMNFLKADDVLWFASTEQILTDFVFVADYADKDMYVKSIKNLKNYSARVVTQKSVVHDWYNNMAKYKLDEPKFTSTKFQSAGQIYNHSMPEDNDYEFEVDDDYADLYKQLELDENDPTYLNYRN